MSYEFSQKWYRTTLTDITGTAGLGVDEFLGPDQPWTAGTASKWITERTRQCPADREIHTAGMSPRKYTSDGKPINVEECFATGRVKESSKPGYQRVQEWCCPKPPVIKVTQTLTAAQGEQYATACDGKTLTLPSGESFPTHLSHWLHKSRYAPTAMCVQSGIAEGDYNLLCCRDMPTGPLKIIGTTMASSARPQMTVEQIEQVTQEQAARAAQVEAVLVQSAEPEYGFFERYKWVIIFAAGAIGVGVISGMIKKMRMKKEQEA